MNLRSLAAKTARLSLREKALAAAIGAVALAFWAVSLLRGVSEVRARLDMDASAKVAQDAWLGVAPSLEKSLAAKSAGLADARRLDAEAVMVRLEKLLGKAGLAAESARPSTADSGVCRTHRVTLRSESATLEKLVAFRRALDASGLPIAVTAMEIEAGGDGTALRVSMDVTALELK